MAAEPLRSDAEFHMFGQQHPHAIKIVLKDTCMPCQLFKQEHLPGVLLQMQVLGVPVGLANWSDLSPQLRSDQSLFRSWPALLYFKNGRPSSPHPQYAGQRTPSVFADWLSKQMAS